MRGPLELLTTPSSADFTAADEIALAFAEALKNRTFSCAAMVIGTADRALFLHCWGAAQWGGSPIDETTWFDLASLTKPLVTTLLCANAVERRLFSLDDSLGRFFPNGLVPSDKKAITIRQLLAHCSGLPPYLPFYKELIRLPFPARQTALLDWIVTTPLLASPGKTTAYSDLGFIVLGKILQTVQQDSLDKLAHRFIFAPLSIDAPAFFKFEPVSDPTIPPDLPHANDFHVAATEHCPWRQRLLMGEVHDENAYCLGGVAAHAGLFGTAAGVYHLLAHLFRSYRDKPADALLSSDVLKTFWRRQEIDRQSTWALGFDTPSAVNSNAGRFFSANTIGHLGFTGTSFWMDLDQEVMVILLTNRVHPTRSNEKIREFRPLIHNLAMKAYYELSK